MAQSVIKVQDLSKRYRIGLKEKQADTLVGQIVNSLKTPLENFKRLRQLSRFGEEDESVFWALKDINFEVKQGEVLGIIGKNGAGKSTLLKILSQIAEPTAGRIEIHGRVASLLEVGTGFHPELSGRDNIYMNGTILGMSKQEIDSKLEEIIDFSGVEKFIDTPVKFYSSGMKVRLGFSVAAHLDPEILIIDEVLAVGDFEFQEKCLGKIKSISKYDRRTVIFVSHNLGAVSNLCTRGILLTNGAISGIGEISQILNQYLDGNEAKSSIESLSFAGHKDLVCKFEEILINGKNPFSSSQVISPEDSLEISFSMFPLTKNPVKITFSLFRDGNRIFSVFDSPNRRMEEAKFTSEFIVPENLLRPGFYSIGFGADDSSGNWVWFENGPSFQVLEIFSEKLDKPAIGLLNLKGMIRVKREKSI
ncbi:ABC transporter ATP-binding protein [Algoriphagus persicinus]|uniref:ABC transporter ATP-binding protein n=1 Tax=Algoriphagus persicinus TaxID=3108754 RepID=UPI002B3692D0|nr:ABC transporter ATP-binding protein [Algoriphagus sp. E1-3-M2]MEB2784741.1 ABC transporter ATP-binding protein [Algoriphagus sp. E1-3-M2]